MTGLHGLLRTSKNTEGTKSLFVFLVFFDVDMLSQGPHGVEDGKDGDADIGKDGHPHGGNAQ